MKLKAFKSQFIEALNSLYDEQEIESFFYIILEAFHQMKRIDFALNPEIELDTIQFLQWDTVLEQLKTYKPIQYILGETEFYGLPMYVSENTLIPRPETEELVEWIIQELELENRMSPLKILDIGTGTGCIAIALAKNLPNAQVFALDVSDKALEIAQKNAQRNQVVITFLQQSILDTEDLGQNFDIIVSNPPYVRHLEKEEIKKNVLDFEPHLALFVEDDDALLFYRKIAELARKNLNQNGFLFFEINQYLGPETISLLEKMNYNSIVLRQDIYGNNRMIRSRL